MNDILNIYGISQNPNTKDFIIVFEYAEGGSFNNWINMNCKNFSWLFKINTLLNISNGLKEIHQKQIVHRDLHTGNILFFIELLNNYDNYYRYNKILSISDMGLCKEVSNIDNIDDTKIYGVMPYITKRKVIFSRQQIYIVLV